MLSGRAAIAADNPRVDAPERAEVGEDAAHRLEEGPNAPIEGDRSTSQRGGGVLVGTGRSADMACTLKDVRRPMGWHLAGCIEKKIHSTVMR